MTQWPYDHFPTGGDEGGMPPIDDELRIHLDAVLGTVPESRIGSGELGFGKLLALVDRLAAAERTEFAADGRPSLRSAVAEAIAGNRKLAERGGGLRTLAGSLQGREAVRRGPTSKKPRQQVSLDTEQTLLGRRLTRGRRELASRRLQRLDSFDIVLFCRARDGQESSLIEALRRRIERTTRSLAPASGSSTTTVRSRRSAAGSRPRV